MPHAPKTMAPGKRASYYIRAGSLLVAVLASCIFATLIAARLGVSWDATATREHRLSSRTTAMLDGLDGAHEVIVAANFGTVDPRASQRTLDVLSLIDRKSDNVTVTVLNAASPRDLAELDALLERLAQRASDAMSRRRGAIEGAADEASRLAAAMADYDTALKALRDEARGGDPRLAQLATDLDQLAAVMRILAERLTVGAEQSRAALRDRIGGGPIPPLDAAGEPVRVPLSQAAEQLRALELSLDALGRAQDEAVTGAIKDRAKGLVTPARADRDAAARAVAAIEDTPSPAVVSVARVLARTSAVLVVGPPPLPSPARSSSPGGGGVTAIDGDAIFPPRGLGEGGPSPDPRVRAEELVATALATLSSDAAPIVVFVHGATERERLSPRFAPLRALVDRLSLRGIAVAEWAAAVDDAPPSITRIDPTGGRPVVYAVIGTNVSGQDGPARLRRLADAVRGLAARGERVLLSVPPSSLPTFGERDPLVSFLDEFGVMVDSARPLMRQSSGPRGRAVTTDTVLVPGVAEEGGEGAEITGALSGLRVLLPWAVPVRPADPGGSGDGARVTVTELLRVAAQGSEVWAESDWQTYWSVPAAQRGSVRDPPAPDTARDDTAGPWAVGAAIERRGPDGRPQRLVVIGSNGWFFDAITQQPAGVIDGRAVPAQPGNIELFESAVYWLAGQDAMIARGASSQAVPTIRAMTESQVSGVRWALIAGLPLMVLLVGAAWRVVRG